MAENPNKISQIQVGDITYDICDVAARDKSAEIENYLNVDNLFYTVACMSDGEFTLTAEGTAGQAKEVTWEKVTNMDETTFSNNYYFLGYTFYKTGSTDVFFFRLGEDWYGVRNVSSTGSRTISPTAAQLYIKKF